MQALTISLEITQRNHENSHLIWHLSLFLEQSMDRFAKKISKCKVSLNISRFTSLFYMMLKTPKAESLWIISKALRLVTYNLNLMFGSYLICYFRLLFILGMHRIFDLPDIRPKFENWICLYSRLPEIYYYQTLEFIELRKLLLKAIAKSEGKLLLQKREINKRSKKER